MKPARLLGLLLALAALLSGCEKPAEPPAPPRPALVIKVGAAELNQPMVLVGEVKSRYEFNQGFRIGGKIIERKVEVGSRVEKGQLLARLDAADTQLSASAAFANVRAAEAGLALAKSEVERQRQLVDKKFISASSLDKFEAELKTASARVNQAKAQAAVSGNQSQYTSLHADRAGVVTQIHAEPGQVVQAGEMIAQIVDTTQIEVKLAVPESHMQQLNIGDAVTIKLWADSADSYAGTVREIAPAADSATRTFDVRVQFTQIDDKVRLGMTAGVSFGKGTQNALMVPSSAVTQKNGQTLVWVIDKNGIANPRPVQIGAFSEQGVPVLQGLQAGELVAIVGVHTLVAGQQVSPQLAQASWQGVR